MADHYYSEHPQSEMKIETNQYEIDHEMYTFATSTGVFSKKGIDFGTKFLIESFEMPRVSGAILDLGCGYGPIGLSIAKKCPDCIVEMVDINARAVQLSKKNAQLNAIHNVNIYQSDGLEAVMNNEFVVIISNPPIRAGKEKIYQMFRESYDKLLTAGELWIVIQKKQGAPSAKKYLETLFESVEVVGRSKGYYVLKAIK